MNLKSIASNLSVAILAQGLALLLSIITSLLVPKLLGVTEFGYWQLFLFYASYVGVFQFGLNDGIYLIAGGQTLDTIDRAWLKSQFYVGLVIEIMISIVIIFCSFVMLDNASRTFVIASTAVYLVIQNTSAYFGYVFQALNQTKWYSYSIMVDRACFAISLVVLLLLSSSSFEPYVIAFILSKTICVLFCFVKGKFIFKNTLLPLNDTLKVSFNSIRVGIKLMVASLSSMLILGVARFVVDLHWSIDSFAEFSFALSLVNFIAVFISQISMVLFPALRQAKGSEISRFYQVSRDALGISLPVVLVLYYPVVALLELWLPQYSVSFQYFALLLPLCIFNAQMDVTCTTLFKVQRRERLLLLINLATMLVSGVLCIIAVYIFENMNYMLLGISIVITARWALSDGFLLKGFGISGLRLQLSEVIFCTLCLGVYCFWGGVAELLVSVFGYAMYLAVNRAKIPDLIKLASSFNISHR